ncbi:MAG: hypothetical protein AAGG68_07135 [Bacteroidota bacterium]
MNTWLSLLAVLVSFGAFGVSIYEASIMREQQKIMYQEQQLMLEQQRASVWPYLESNIDYMVNEEESKITYSFKNKGVGPAKINQLQLSLKDSIVADYSQILEIITSVLPANVGGNMNFVYRPPNGILSPEEELTWFSVQIPRFKGDQGVLWNFLLEFELCYCSIYKDCWTLKSKDDEPEEGCKLAKEE